MKFGKKSFTLKPGGITILAFSIGSSFTYGQTAQDTIQTLNIQEITVESSRIQPDIYRLPPVKGTYIHSGKKSEVIQLSEKNVALTEKYGRQIFAKIPGVFVYDMDGTGNQINISTRGLDPHRGWEFNIRKDGIITNSDMYGYPASHYNIPMEAVDRIELVRGTGSLQYGGQFGGMLNYISKLPDTLKKFSFENINTIGSYGLVSTFNRASGKWGKFRYSTWVNKKWITGYRDDSDAQYNAEAVSLYYDVNPDLHFKLEWTHSNYVIHLAGPLTDNMFKNNPRMATRDRNYYNPNINVPSLTMDWTISPNTQLLFTSSAVLGSRNSVMYDKLATIPDSIVTATKQYNNRQVDIDNFNSYTSELRILHNYKLFNQSHVLTTGAQYMNNDLHRRQLGKGTTGDDFDLSLVTPGWGRDLHLKTKNIALFAENRWALTNRLSVNTGLRVEVGKTDMTGTITYYTETEIPNQISHKFPLFGAGAQYDLTRKVNLYAGWSQSYRPVIFKDIIPGSIFEISDKQLEDAFGSNAEVGFRGKWKFLHWDITGFYLQYKNRLGTLAQVDNLGNQIIFRTNIGDSYTAGLEFFLQGDFYLNNRASLSLYTSTSYMDARYQNAVLRSGNTNVNIDGNKVESVPEWISRNGITLNFPKFNFSSLMSYTSESFADAFNTVTPSATGASGLVPSYFLMDLNGSVRLSEKIRLQINANNVLDKKYFTKRPQFYPGPGIWPSDGRTYSVSIAIKL